MTRLSFHVSLRRHGMGMHTKHAKSTRISEAFCHSQSRRTLRWHGNLGPGENKLSEPINHLTSLPSEGCKSRVCENFYLLGHNFTAVSVTASNPIWKRAWSCVTVNYPHQMSHRSLTVIGLRDNAVWIQKLKTLPFKP
jgi:hypothetical protein